MNRLKYFIASVLIGGVCLAFGLWVVYFALGLVCVDYLLEAYPDADAVAEWPVAMLAIPDWGDLTLPFGVAAVVGVFVAIERPKPMVSTLVRRYLLLTAVVFGVTLIAGVWGGLFGAGTRVAKAVKLADDAYQCGGSASWALIFGDAMLRVAMTMGTCVIALRSMLIAWDVRNYRQSKESDDERDSPPGRMLEWAEKVFFGQAEARLKPDAITSEDVAYYAEHPEELEMLTSSRRMFGRLMVAVFLLSLLSILLSRFIEFLTPAVQASDVVGRYTWYLALVFLKDVVFENGAALLGGVITVVLLNMIRDRREQEARVYRQRMMELIEQNRDAMSTPAIDAVPQETSRGPVDP